MTADEDFEGLSFSLTLPMGLSAGNSSCFTVPIFDDVIVEDRETFSAVLNHVEVPSSTVTQSSFYVKRHKTDVVIVDNECELMCVKSACTNIF